MPSHHKLYFCPKATQQKFNIQKTTVPAKRTQRKSKYWRKYFLHKFILIIDDIFVYDNVDKDRNSILIIYKYMEQNFQVKSRFLKRKIRLKNGKRYDTPITSLHNLGVSYFTIIPGVPRVVSCIGYILSF